MIETGIGIRTPDGTSEGLLYLPEEHGSWPGILFLTDIIGIRASQRAMAARICSEGYVVLMPNLYYRAGKPPLFEKGTKMGDEKFTRRMGEILSQMTPDAIDQDNCSYVDYFCQQASVMEVPFGALGLCVSGSTVLRMAAARPDQIGAGASFHGGRLYTDAPTSPHRLLPRIKARLYFGHAVNDRSMPPAAIDNLNRSLQSWGGKYESEVYEGAHHGWTVVDSPAFNPPQAERAFRVLRRLFAEALVQAR
ncbi:dienelactone hydrolase family protein [Acidobacteria bacterium AB60]|nr:dienelactone hydrolase family protein [Acidobacteria bacterium AB60]